MFLNFNYYSKSWYYLWHISHNIFNLSGLFLNLLFISKARFKKCILNSQFWSAKYEDFIVWIINIHTVDIQKFKFIILFITAFVKKGKRPHHVIFMKGYNYYSLFYCHYRQLKSTPLKLPWPQIGSTLWFLLILYE